MNPRYALFFKLVAAVLFIVLLAVVFPPVMKFVEMGARELRYLWWLVLLLACLASRCPDAEELHHRI
ncbi:MAG: hypothetical protein NTZ16_03915 [Verrucomicrobia bacterium]|nr:hypothetical protein [Verrucomicrobiota bacterium]